MKTDTTNERISGAYTVHSLEERLPFCLLPKGAKITVGEHACSADFAGGDWKCRRCGWNSKEALYRRNAPVTVCADGLKRKITSECGRNAFDDKLEVQKRTDSGTKQNFQVKKGG